MTAKLDMAHTRFSFMDNEKVYKPNWVAPEGWTHQYTRARSLHHYSLLFNPYPLILSLPLSPPPSPSLLLLSPPPFLPHSLNTFSHNYVALQHRPEDYDKRAADMYSFAIILWELATNKVPFAGLSPMHAGIKVRSPMHGSPMHAGIKVCSPMHAGICSPVHAGMYGTRSLHLHWSVILSCSTYLLTLLLFPDCQGECTPSHSQVCQPPSTANHRHLLECRPQQEAKIWKNPTYPWQARSVV